jgi:hypothetical protein
MSERDFTIDLSPATAILRGVMRLESVEAYDRVLAPMRTALEAASTYTLDLRELVFLNSSGIRALGELVLWARDAGRQLAIIAASAIPWQRKTFASLSKLHAALTVEYV